MNSRKNGKQRKEISKFGAKKSDGPLKMATLKERSVGLEHLNLFTTSKKPRRDTCLLQAHLEEHHLLRSYWNILFGIMTIGRRNHNLKKWKKTVLSRMITHDTGTKSDVTIRMTR